MQTAIFLKMLVNRMGVFAVHFDLLHHRKLDIKVLFDELIDFLRSPALLFAELVAWKSNYLETF